MGPAGVTEIIAHFAGYMRVADDFARFRMDYDGGRAPHDAPWAPDPVPEPHRVPFLDDLNASPFRVTVPEYPYPLIGAHPHPLHFPRPVPLLATHLHLVDLQPDQLPTPSLGGGGEVTSLPVQPDQELIVIDQVNVLQNNDTVLMVQGTAVTSLHGTGSTDELHGLIASAQAEAPGWMPADNGNQTLVDAIAAHDAQTAANGGAPASTLTAGLVTDGVLQPAGTPFSPSVPTATAVDGDTSHNGMLTPGLVAETGGNVAANIASIVDNHTQHTGLVVYGNAYSTNAIVQVNVLSSLAQIEVGGASGALDIVTGGNLASNTASFATHDVDAGFVSHFSAGSSVEVDRIGGNFYDVKGLTQLNYMHDNDTVVQGTMSTYYEVDSGNNTQINDLPLTELNQHYDLIIVHGSFHVSNVILQQNILLNDDIVKMLTTRGDTVTQSIVTGDNTLHNAAAIDQYGNQTYQPLDGVTAASIARLENGTLDAAVVHALEGNGTGTLHVLDITGDFYDINYVSQTNVIGNVDTAVQYLPNTGSSTAPNGATTTSTETIHAGGNQLANIAGIAVVGTTSAFQFVGGQHYDDAILVQANLVSDKASVTIGDTHTLASEVVAFTGLHDVEPPAPAPTVAVHTDPTAHHDLFHGMMT